MNQDLWRAIVEFMPVDLWCEQPVYEIWSGFAMLGVCRLLRWATRRLLDDARSPSHQEWLDLAVFFVVRRNLGGRVRCPRQHLRRLPEWVSAARLVRIVQRRLPNYHRAEIEQLAQTSLVWKDVSNRVDWTL